MIRFLENYSLKTHNTFGIDVLANYFFDFTNVADLDVFFKSNTSWKEEKLLLLGGGSNLLFIKDFDGLVIHSNVPGIEIIKEDRQNIWIEAGAGEDWDEFVQYCVTNEFGGLENLSLIPGNVGAAPVQNIGAYGSEVCNFIEAVNGFDLQTLNLIQIPAEQCKFGYRNSIFKNELKGKFIVTSVVFKLEKFPKFVLGYGDVKAEVNRLGEVTLRNIRQAVLNIRSSKLPDVMAIGNAGSFFKNPVVEVAKANSLKLIHSEMPLYPVNQNSSKLAAGWLIDQCNWKGYRTGDAGVHEKQALVLVNYGNATGKEIFDLSMKIKKSVFEKFGVELEMEVNVI